MYRLICYLRGLFKPAPLLAVTFDSGGRKKPTIVLIHGIAATSKTWNDFIKELGHDKYRIVTVDVLGFGKSPKPTNFKYNVDDHTASLHRTLKKLKIRKPYKIVGHSMGAIIGAHFTRYHQRNVDSAYLLALPVYIKNTELHTNFSKKQTDVFINAYEFMLRQKDFTITASKVLRKIFRIYDGIDVNEANWNSFKLSIKNTIINQDVYQDIKNIKVPTYIVYGSFDEFIVQKSIKQLESFDNVKLVKLFANDHIVNRRFAREVVKLINNV